MVIHFRKRGWSATEPFRWHVCTHGELKTHLYEPLNKMKQPRAFLLNPRFCKFWVFCGISVPNSLPIRSGNTTKIFVSMQDDIRRLLHWQYFTNKMTKRWALSQLIVPKHFSIRSFSQSDPKDILESQGFINQNSRRASQIHCRRVSFHFTNYATER